MIDPTINPDPTPLKSANIFEAIEAIKQENPRIDYSEVDYYLQEDFSDKERNRKAFAELKQSIDGINSKSGWKVILKRIIKKIKL